MIPAKHLNLLSVYIGIFGNVNFYHPELDIILILFKINIILQLKCINGLTEMHSMHPVIGI